MISKPLTVVLVMPDMSVQENTVEIQLAEMVAYLSESNPQEENDGLMDWWRTVEGWAAWNEMSNLDEEDLLAEQAADRVFMGARLFVHLFNRHGASLQKRIYELLAQAEAADHFHKRTVQVALGGGVTSVTGRVATIVGLILARFTFGASMIVTATGIGVATAGSCSSAMARITDAVHFSMSRKKRVERMIQGYQDEIKDISKCLEFIQEGMDTLQEWDFERYSESVSKKALNQNIQHVMREGGRAGKALLVNTEKVVSTVQVLGAAGGAAKATEAISITTGVMTALFLVLDVFFVVKDSHELWRGAKTKFSATIREVCKDLQDRLMELNKVKGQLQKTMMDGMEQEEEEEEEIEEEDDLESDPVKLAQLEQELDLLEEKLDKKVLEEQRENKSKKEKEENSEGRETESKRLGRKEEEERAEGEDPESEKVNETEQEETSEEQDKTGSRT